MFLRHQWATFWRRISRPNPAIQSPYEQQQAHLLSSILAALLLASFVMAPTWILTNPQYPAAAPIGTALCLGLLLAYGLSRSIHYTIGAWMLIAILFGLVIAVLLTAPTKMPDRMLVLNFLAICVMLASLLLSIRATAVIAGLSILIIMPYFFVPSIHFAITYSFLVFIIITSALILTTTVIRRDYVERLHLSEDGYRVLLEAIPDLMFRHKRDGTYVDCYAYNSDLLVVDPSLLLGKTVYEVLPTDIADKFMRSIERVLSTGKMTLFEYSLVLHEVEVFFEARMVRFNADEVLTIVRNVTERHYAEIALKQSEERFSSAFRNSPVPMVISTIDPQYPIYIEANDAYLKLVGYTWDEIKGRSLIEMGVTVPGKERDSRLATLDSAGYYAVREAQICNNQQEIRDVLISAQRITIDGMVCDLELLLDVTEQRLLEKKAVELELETKNVQVLSKFIQDASHEFRTPLADISNRIYLLNSLKDEAKRQRHADHAQKQIQALTNLLDILFVMARLDSGLPFVTAPADLNMFLGILLAAYEFQLSANKLTLTFDLSADLPPVPIHEEFLQQAIRQIVDNAIRYNVEGGHISIKTVASANTVTLTIANTGIGISPDDLPHVFERFWRHDEAHTTPGFGLGLSIARHVARQHNGDISITSPGSGQGATVTLTLPLISKPKSQPPRESITPVPQKEM